MALAVTGAHTTPADHQSAAALEQLARFHTVAAAIGADREVASDHAYRIGTAHRDLTVAEVYLLALEKIAALSPRKRKTRASGARSHSRYAGSDGAGAAHCDDCRERGHVLAHPDLGCGDVGCDVTHPDAWTGGPGRVTR